MRCPSLERLAKTFPGVSDANLRLVRRLAAAADSPVALEKLVNTKCPTTKAYVDSMHSDPYHSRMWRVTVALHAMDIALDTNGVEGLGPTSGPDYAPPYEYLNTGDPYRATLVYKRSTDSLSINCWGDIAERHPSW